MNNKIIFNFAIKLIGLYYIISSITSFELSLGILLSYSPDNSENLTTILTQMFFICLHFIMNLFIILKSEKILDLIYKNNKTDLSSETEEQISTNINNFNMSDIIHGSVILIGFIIVITNIGELALSIKDYYNVMIKFGGINADLTVVKFYGKPALLNTIIGILVILFQNKISYWLTNKINIENLKSIK